MKLLKVLLAVLLLVTIPACKSKETKSVESMIESLNLEDLTISSGEEIFAAKTAYEALEEKDAKSVANYTKLEEADKSFEEFYLEQADHAADLIEEANQKINEFDIERAYTLFEEALPLAKSLKESPYSDLLTNDPEKAIQDWLDLLDQACYPNTHLITLTYYPKLAKVSNADCASSNEGEGYNVSDKTGLKYMTYMYSSGQKIVNAFKAYSDYWKSQMTLENIEQTDNGALYTFKDSQGRDFALEWLIVSIYGTDYLWICVHVDDSVPLVKK